jgi:uncharacterized protein
MTLIRNKYLKNIELWSKKPRPKPLLLWGSRQVGKTHLMITAADKYFPDYLYLNFEKDKSLAALFRESLSPNTIAQNLSLRFNRSIDPKSTLLIFDEIQECDDALNSLKYFAESPDSHRVIAAGSLLGVKRSKKGFPVGQVEFLNIHPLNFLEFLDFTGHEKLSQQLSHVDSAKDFPDAFHAMLSRLQREYCWTGGMPEVVATFAANPANPLPIREVQNQIVQSYQLDFAKHAPPELVSKIGAIFEQIPRLLAKENKKFSYSNISANARSRDYADALQWLLDARMVHKVKNISQVDMPLESHAQSNIFKVYPLDVGLLGALLEAPTMVVLESEGIFSNFKGALAECFVAQELISHGFSKLYYWTSKGTAEVDFVVQKENKVLPLEVKSGVNVRSKSLNAFGEYYAGCQLSRCSTRKFEVNGKFTNYPLYALAVFANRNQG